MVSKNFLRQFNSSKINILHNRVILYFVLFLSTINLVSYGLVRDYFTPTIFIIVAMITSFFSKNMTVILSIALVSCNILKQGSKIRLNEGMETSDTKGDAADSPTPTDSEVASVETKNKMKDDKAKDDTMKDDKVKNIKIIEDKYKELLMLQDKILGNISTLEDSLGSAEKIVKSMSKTVSPP
jgi:hypothetical protein